MSKNDGGPAFPAQPVQRIDGAEIAYEQGGMSLRDWFATHATEEDVREWCDNGYTTRESAKYAYADAMLVARERTDELP